MFYRTIVIGLITIFMFTGTTWASFKEVNDKELQSKLQSVLKGQLEGFRIVRLQMDSVSKQLATGKAGIPIMNSKGELMEAAMPARPIRLRSPDHNGMAVVSWGKGKEVHAKKINLPREQTYQLGQCQALKKGDPEAACGNLVILDQAQTMAVMMSVDPKNGMSVTEPVNTLLGTKEYKGLHIVYNSAFHIPIDLNCDLDAKPEALVGINLDFGSMHKQTNVILECDSQFYSLDPGTAWSRMDAIWGSVKTVYNLFQGAWNEDWRLSLPVIGHQGWIAGYGPSATNKTTLSQEIEETRLYSPFTEDDLHHFFVGYNVSGVYGRAGGIGSVAGGIGNGHNHAYSEARTTQTHFAKFIVAAHEAGHLLGGVHGDGQAGMCIWPTYCGGSIMLAGSGGAPDTRVPFFSGDNSDNIGDVIEAYLSDYP